MGTLCHIPQTHHHFVFLFCRKLKVVWQWSQCPFCAVFRFRTIRMATQCPNVKPKRSYRELYSSHVVADQLSRWENPWSNFPSTCVGWHWEFRATSKNRSRYLTRWCQSSCPFTMAVSFYERLWNRCCDKLIGISKCFWWTTPPEMILWTYALSLRRKTREWRSCSYLLPGASLWFSLFLAKLWDKRILQNVYPFCFAVTVWMVDSADHFVETFRDLAMQDVSVNVGPSVWHCGRWHPWQVSGGRNWLCCLLQYMCGHDTPFRCRWLSIMYRYIYEPLFITLLPSQLRRCILTGRKYRPLKTDGIFNVWFWKFGEVGRFSHVFIK